MHISKNLLVLAFTVTTYSIGFGQVWFDMGVKGSYGITMMANKNIFDDREVDHKITGGYGFGVSLGTHFGDHQGVLIEYMRSKGKQNFDEEMGSVVQANNYNWSTNDVLLLYRYTGYGAYFEVGPKLSFVSDVMNTYRDQPTMDVTPYFEDKWISGVIGFGSYIAGSDLFTLQIGLRLYYQFGDMINADGQALNLPAYVEYDSYKKTNAVAALLHLEFNYAFGRFAKASCRDRWKLILFQ
jgi:hypothetical protein